MRSIIKIYQISLCKGTSASRSPSYNPLAWEHNSRRHLEVLLRGSPRINCISKINFVDRKCLQGKKAAKITTIYFSLIKHLFFFEYFDHPKKKFLRDKKISWPRLFQKYIFSKTNQIFFKILTRIDLLFFRKMAFTSLHMAHTRVFFLLRKPKEPKELFLRFFGSEKNSLGFLFLRF